MNWKRRTKYMGFYTITEYYPVPAYGNTTKKSSRRKKTTLEQKENNLRYAKRELQGKIIANFVAGRDLFITLTHVNGTSEQEARKALDSVLKYLREYFRKSGYKFKYIAVTEKQEHWHHHLIMSYVPLEVIKKKWSKYAKRITYSPLDMSNEYFDLVEYLLSEEKPSRKEDATEKEKLNAKHPRKKHEKRWTCSQGLAVPPNRESISKYPPKKLKAPKGYKIIEGTVRRYQTWYGEIVTFESQWVGKGLPKYYEKRQEKLLNNEPEKIHKRRKRKKE